MNQAEINKKAMADIFAIEDSRELFEAIGSLNDDKALGDPMAEGGEYGPDDMLTVIPGSTDPFAGQSITAQSQQEPTDDDKRFVVDRLAELMAKDHKNVVSPTEIDVYSPIIQKEVGSRVNVNQFLTDVHNDATQRLAAQNVSEAQPEGAVSEDIVPPEAAQEAPVDPTGVPEMEPAPGGIAPEPSLDANVGEPAPADPMAGDDLGLGGITDDGAGFDDFGAGESAPAGDDLGLDAITDGEGDIGGEPAPEDDLGLDGITDGEGDLGGDLGGDEGAASEDDVLGGDTNLDSLSDDDLGGEEGAEGGEAGAEGDAETKDTGKDDTISADNDDDDAAFEAEMAENRAILESIYEKYTEDVARKNVRNIIESHMRTRKAAKPMTESAVKDDKAKLEACATEMREVLGKKVGDLCEAENESKAEKILESVAKAFVGAASRKETKKVDDKLKAKLESISAGYHKIVRKDAARREEAKAASKLQAKLESILDRAPAKPSKATEMKAKLESIAASAPAITRKDTLQEKLDKIVSEVK